MGDWKLWTYINSGSKEVIYFKGNFTLEGMKTTKLDFRRIKNDKR